MPGFFSHIQGFFSAKHSGKYFATLLRELAFQDPAAFARIFELSREERTALGLRELQIEREWQYRTSVGKKRAADLAILSQGDPVLLIEVKEDDFNNPGNPAQLLDYLDFIRGRKGRTRFIHVSRYRPTAKNALQLNLAANATLPVRSKRYRDILAQLGRTEFSRMFRDYLRDIGVSSYQTIDLTKDSKKIAFFLAQALGFPHSSGLGRLHSRVAADEMAEMFKKMFGNLEAIGEWVRNANQDLFAHRFVRKYSPSPYFDIRMLKRALASVHENEGELPGDGKLVRSGYVHFFTNGRFSPTAARSTGNKAKWLQVELGISLWLERDAETRDRPVSIMLYAEFYGSGLGGAHAYVENLGRFPTEEQLMRRMRLLLERARDKAVRNDPANKHRALRKFSIP
jgi:hypothetical protein